MLSVGDKFPDFFREGRGVHRSQDRVRGFHPGFRCGQVEGRVLLAQGFHLRLSHQRSPARPVYALVQLVLTSEGHSAHVTIGLTVFTWVELVSELVASCTNIAGFRTALPPGFAKRDNLTQTLKDELVQRLDHLLQNGDLDGLIETFLRKVRSGRPDPERNFQSDARVIGLRTLLKAPDASRYRVSSENGGAVLEFQGRTFGLPSHVRAMLEEMCNRTSFRPGELSGPLDDDGKLGLARYLHGEGFLTLAD